MRIHGHLVIAGLLCVAALPGIAEAKDRAEGWRNWTERAERILAAMQSGESARLDSACTGVTRTVIGQGFAFPGWAQSLIQVCTVTQAAYHGSENSRRSKRICSDLRSVSKKIGKAAPVPESPDAHRIAQRISRIMIEIRNQACVNFM
ncbi:hypothetical protein OF829_02920 [Sphingomonas sp. LB-2]|uniref:hypothetical protein n=1 Tax=Sphingomonas caeni TaxID=2984949 RepID=UPI00222E0B74|nr:hypothetical protein [Sphingomonas caeni]MCW3846175.1 hypothetical protein [Sphingomonas caeni]